MATISGIVFRYGEAIERAPGGRQREKGTGHALVAVAELLAMR